MPEEKKYEIVPNTARIIIKQVKFPEQKGGGIIIPGQLKAGENLFIGEIVHPGPPMNPEGKTKYQKGQFVYYSEYSASALFPLAEVVRGKMTYGEAVSEENALIVVAEDDVMAYEEVI